MIARTSALSAHETGTGSGRTRRRLALAAALAGSIAALTIALADPGSPLAVTNVDSPDPIASGAEITYTINVVNTGGAKVTNVVLSDQLNGVGGIGVPPQLVVTSTRGSCQQTVSLVTCNAGTIPGNGTWVVTIRGIVTAASGTTINNTVSVSGTKSAQNFTTTATATTLVSGGGGSHLPDLTIAKTGPTSVVKSSPMIYTLTINNLGTANATDIKVSDTLPLGVSGVTQAGTSLFVCTNNEAAPPFPGAPVTVSCQGGAVNQGANATVTINATAPPTVGTITNTASVDPDNTIEEANELNNSSALVNTEVIDPVGGGLLSIDKTDKDEPVPVWDDGAGPDPVTPGQRITYKILVTNTSAFRADDVVVVDGTQGLEAATIQASQIVTGGTVGTFGGCTVAAPQARCSIRSLDPGGTLLMTVSGQVVAAAGSTIINTATVTGNIKNAGTTNTDTELTTVRPAVDLTVTKADAPDPVCAASWPTTTANGGSKPAPANPPLLAPPVCLGGLVYSFVLGNSGINPASNVVLRDPLPAGVAFDHYTDPGGVFPAGGCTSGAGNVVTCIGGTLPASSTRTITFVVAAPPSVGPISNTVTIDPANAIFEADETNNSATQSTQVATGVDLAIVKLDNGNNPITGALLPGFDPIARSGSQTYTILVDNLGPQDVSNIHVRDTLPANTTLRSAQGDHGFTCSQNGNVVDCMGGSLPGTNREFYSAPPAGAQHATIVIKLFAQPTPGTMHNEARVDPLNQIAEVNEANNIAFQDTVVQDGGPGAFNDLTIEKTPKGTTIRPNDVITYSLKVTNTGTDPAVNVSVRDVLPAEGTFVSGDDVTPGPASAAFTCAHAGGVVNCTGGTLDGTDNLLAAPDIPVERTIEIKVRAPNKNTSLFNQAFVDPDNTIPEGNETNNTDTATTTVASVINLKIEKHGPTQSSQSQVSKYELKVTNEEPGGAGTGQDAFGVKVVDQLPVGLIPLAVTAEPNFGCTVSENPINLVECIGDLGKGKTVTITIDIFQTAEGGRSLDNEACVDPDDTIEESNETDNCSTASTSTTGEQPKLKPDLVVVKSVSPSGPVTTGTLLVYTISVLNSGTANAKGPLTLTDTLPDHVTFVNADTTDLWTCTHASGVVTCHEPPAPNGGDGLAVGASATITINATYDGGATAPLVNTATVAPAEVDPGPDDTHENETNTQNNTAIAKNSVGGSGIDLVLSTIVDNPDPVQNGQTLTYTVVVVNGGTEDTTTTGKQVVVRLDTPQTGTVFLSAAGSNGFNCDPPNASKQIICRGDLPGGGDTTITAKFTVTAGAPFDLNLTATVDPDNTIPETIEVVNNTQTEVTTVFGDACPGPPCIDLVAAQLVGTPDPYPNNGTVTMSFTLVNIGDTSTSLDPDPTHGERLLRFDVFGQHVLPATRTVTPTVPGTVTCQDALNNNTTLQTDCFGNLGPGQAVTVTVVFNGVTSAIVFAAGQGDPDGKVTEFLESNNSIALIINKQP